jgi:hypothetical protein
LGASFLLSGWLFVPELFNPFLPKIDWNSIICCLFKDRFNLKWAYLTRQLSLQTMLKTKDLLKSPSQAHYFDYLVFLYSLFEHFLFFFKWLLSELEILRHFK